MELGTILPQVYENIRAMLLGWGGPEWLAEAVKYFGKAGIVITFVAIQPIILVYMERKVAARFQSRLGPMRVGPHGVLQTIADGIKLLLKEDAVPASADRFVHRIAPILTVGPALLAFAAVPFGIGLIAADFSVALMYILAVSSLAVLGIVLGGWASNNKYTLLGGMRSASQMVSYEIPRAMAVLPPVIFAGSLQWSDILAAQEGYRWFIWRYFPVGILAFLLYLIASVAETNRTPFDLPEAESELVAGFHTEYSGMKFALFFLAEYSFMLLACLIAAGLFFGGGEPLVPGMTFIPSWAWMLLKAYLGVFVFMWFRWTFPRMRVDRLMEFSWKFMLPWSFATLFLAGIWALWK